MSDIYNEAYQSPTLYVSPFVTVMPAYGRDYKSKRAALASWDEGQDFIVADAMNPYCGAYINREDAERATGIQAVNIRYDRLRRVCVVKVRH
jgi:hypothetical protein